MKRFLLLLITSFFMSSMAFATININTASESELENLNSVGPVRAKAIVEYRQQHGAFKSKEDIQNVPGIKGGIYDKIKNDIATTGANTAPVKKEGAATKADKAVTKTKEKAADKVEKTAEPVEKKAKAVKQKAEDKKS